MSKGAAKEQALGALHTKVAEVFQRVLEGYCDRLDRARDAAELDTEEMDEVAGLATLELLEFEPNPSMLTAITKFLKDNEITVGSDELASLSDQERRLSEKRKNRANVTVLSELKVVGDE